MLVEAAAAADSLELVVAEADSLELVAAAADSLELVAAVADLLELVAAAADSLELVAAEADSLELVAAAADCLAWVRAPAPTWPSSRAGQLPCSESTSSSSLSSSSSLWTKLRCTIHHGCCWPGTLDYICTASFSNQSRHLLGSMPSRSTHLHRHSCTRYLWHSRWLGVDN